MVYINDFSSEESMDANGDEPSMLRIPAIIKETENEDRVVDSEIPRVGMTFNSFEEVKDFYKKYATGKGFGITTRSTKCGDDGKMKYYTVACSRAGKPVGSRRSRSVSKRAVRTDCKARINIRACQDGKFYLSGFMSEHNHDLRPESLRNNRCSTSMGPHPEIRVESDEQLETHVNNNFRLTTGIENVSSGNEERIDNMARSESLRLDKLWATCHHIIEIGMETEESFELAMKLLEETKDSMVKHKLENRGNTQDPTSSLVKDGDEVQYSCELHRVLARLHKKRKADAHRAGN